MSLPDTDIPYPELHAAVLAMTIDLHSGSEEHDEFAHMLLNYQSSYARSDRLEELSDSCDRRVCYHERLPLDLIAAYTRLARLSRWRAWQLRGGQ